MNLKEVSTVDLVEELKKREGIDYIEVAPYECYGAHSEEYSYGDIGPATIIIITD